MFRALSIIKIKLIPSNKELQTDYVTIKLKSK